jgi:hypothetical protein
LVNRVQKGNALWKDENTVFFGAASRDEFRTLKEAVEERINNM